VFEALYADETRAFWLDPGIHADTGSSYLGAASPVRPSYLVDQERLYDLRPGVVMPAEGTLDAALRSQSRGAAPGAWSHEAVGADRGSRSADGGASAAPPSPIGWVGWFGYEYGARRLAISVARSEVPEAAMLFADRVIEIDHRDGGLFLWFFDDADGRAWAAVTSERLRSMARGRPPWAGRASGCDQKLPDVPAPSSRPNWRHSGDAYLRMIEACQDSIRAGDAYQLCLTNSVQVATEAPPFDVYRRLRRISQATHGAFVRVDDVAVLSASPELFLQVAGRVAVTRPVKGTRRRGRDAAEDRELARELAADEKERAENLMIVDLMRNDLGRVATVGGVSVPELLEVETHRHVHQLVSMVRAELADGVDVLDVVDACFPAGSMTGAPKLSAMGILHDLERGPRGVYSGCLGRLGLDGSAELAMVIRTIVMRDGMASVGTGGGITALSVAQNELAETELKAAAPLAALGI
jgi:aminodeoxychorismate synthase component I